MLKPILDLLNQTFDRLTVIESLGKGRYGRYYWKCLCVCGKITKASTSSLNAHKVRSCGCLRNERISKWAKDRAALDNTYGLHKLYGNYQRDAIKRGYCFELTLIEFSMLLQDNCFYCNSSPKNRLKHPTAKYIDDFIYNGIDRKDNKSGYTHNNVVSCCAKCNKAKGIMTMHEFIFMAEQITKRCGDLT